MKQVLKKIFAAMLASTCMISMVACGGAAKENEKGNLSAENGEESKESNDKYNISGTVNYAIPTPWYGGGRDVLIEKFKEKYPNITVNVIKYDSDPDSYLTTAAAAGELPDIVEGWTPLIYPLSTGLVQPLDEFLEKDEDIKSVPESIIEAFRIDGKIYGVPTKTVTEGVVLNLDLLESLNLDKPSYDWTFDEFREISKKTTTKQYSAIDTLYVFRQMFMPSFDKNLALAGYNYDTEKFDFTSGGFKKQMDVIMELRAIPGLQSHSLINNTLRDDGKEDDYQKKFGKEVDAFYDGKQAMRGTGTWELDWLKPDFNYDFYTTPVDPAVGYRAQAESDYLYMLNSAEDKEATFELLKWMSYGEEGVLEFLKIREGLENPVPFIYLPVTQTDAIVEKINSSSSIPEGLKYFYNNLDKTYPNPQKVVPGFVKARDEVLHPTINSIFSGETEAGAIAAEMENKANEIVTESWEALRKDMSKYDVYK